MNRSCVVVAVAVLCVSLAAAMPHPDSIHTRLRGGKVYADSVRHVTEHSKRMGYTRNMTENWFPQWIDHKNHSKGTFQQRYFVDYSAWDGNGPAMMYISGEAECHGSPWGYVQDMGHNMSAVMLSLEHRFYGKSMPAPLTDKDALKQLHVENVLADLNHFMSYFETTVARKTLNWFSAGGSYSGALSAWLKQRYPTRLSAAWSSSGVVHPIFDFWQFDHHIATVIEPKCYDAIRNVFSTFSAMWDNEATRGALLKKFGTPAYFSKTDMEWMLADGGAMSVQYGHKSFLCDTILPVGPDPLEQYKTVITTLWGKTFPSSCYYSTKCLSDVSMSAQWADAGYSWVFQCCNQFAWWQIGYPTSIRPKNITTTYYVDQCRSAFWSDILPDVWAFNKKHNGVTPHASNVIALQGSDDPWQTAGVRASISPTYIEVLAQCDGCGHCGDMMPPSPTDPASLVSQRAEISKYLNKWVLNK